MARCTEKQQAWDDKKCERGQNTKEKLEEGVQKRTRDAKAYCIGRGGQVTTTRKEEGTRDLDVVMCGGLPAHEVGVLKEALEESHGNHVHGVLSILRSGKVDSSGNDQSGSSEHYWWTHWRSVVKAQGISGALHSANRCVTGAIAGCHKTVA